VEFGGRKPKLDPRNRLIIPTLEIARALNPRLVVFENVPEMESTLIENSDGQLVRSWISSRVCWGANMPDEGKSLNLPITEFRKEGRG